MRVANPGILESLPAAMCQIRESRLCLPASRTVETGHNLSPSVHQAQSKWRHRNLRPAEAVGMMSLLGARVMHGGQVAIEKVQSHGRKARFLEDI